MTLKSNPRIIRDSLSGNNPKNQNLRREISSVKS